MTDHSTPHNLSQYLHQFTLFVLALALTYYVGYTIGEHKGAVASKPMNERLQQSLRQLDQQLKSAQAETTRVRQSMVAQSMAEHAEANLWASNLRSQLTGELEYVTEQHAKCLTELDQIARHRTTIPITSVRKYVVTMHQNQNSLLTELQNRASERIKMHRIADDAAKRFASIDQRQSRSTAAFKSQHAPRIVQSVSSANVASPADSTFFGITAYRPSTFFARNSDSQVVTKSASLTQVVSESN